MSTGSLYTFAGIIGLIIGHFLYHAVVDQAWSVATERSFFSAAGALIVWVSARHQFKTDDHQ